MRRDGYAASCGAGVHAGFSLLEVLVAVIILSFGVLGVVGLQAASLQANRDARLQSSAVRLGRELAELMRGNKDIALAETNPYIVDYSGTALTAPTQDCYSGACSTTTAVANLEMYDWLSRVNAEMPGVRVKVCFDSTPYNATSGAPQWSCNDPDAGVAAPNHNTQAVVKIGWTRQSTDRKATGAAALVVATNPTVVLPLISGSVQ